MDTQKIHWDQPLEAVHTDGRVVAAVYDRPLDDRGHKVTLDDGEGDWSWYFKPEGHMAVDKEWTIRNVASATPTRNALEQRMHSLIKHAAVNASGYTQDEARAILAELEPVDPDLIEARKITAVPPSDYEHVNDKIRRGHWLNGVYDKDPMIQIALAAIKRGRALERGE